MSAGRCQFGTWAICTSYSEQIQKIKEQNLLKGISYYTKEIGDSQKLKPVISLVLYYGTDDWEAPSFVRHT